MGGVKEEFKQLSKVVKYAVESKDKLVLDQCRNIVITVNPVTGKTSFAKLIFRFYKAYGVLTNPDGLFVEKNGTDMKGVGNTLNPTRPPA